MRKFLQTLTLLPSFPLSVCLSVSSRSAPPCRCWNQIPSWESPPNCCWPAGMRVWEAENNQSHTVSPSTQTPATPAASASTAVWAPKWRLLFSLCQPYKSEASILLSRDIISCGTIIGLSFYSTGRGDILLIKWPRCLWCSAFCKASKQSQWCTFCFLLMTL